MRHQAFRRRPVLSREGCRHRPVHGADRAFYPHLASGGVRPRVPNLLLAKLWRDDEFYLKVLAARDDVLTPSQVVAIRQLAAQGKDERMIFEIVGARNVGQVKRVLAGKTYKRVL